MAGIKIANSDYSREAIESGKSGAALGCSAIDMKRLIEAYEKGGYEVKFETSLLRRLFGVSRYKIMAYYKGSKLITNN